MNACRLLPLVLLLPIASMGCTSANLLQAQANYRQGQFPVAEKQIQAYANKQTKGGNQVIAHLEAGAILRAAGQLEASNAAFDVADRLLEALDDRAQVRVSGMGSEVAAGVTNLNALPYRPTQYDRIMLSTYRALNYFELGQPEAARVELRRAYDRQVRAVERNARELEAARQAARESSGEVDVDRAEQDPAFQARLNRLYGPLAGIEAYRDFVNPFCEFLQGLYHLAAPADASDLERARLSLERTAAMVPENPYLPADLALAAAGTPARGLTYVILETGAAPHREAMRLDIPVFLVSRHVDYAGASFPYLVMHQGGPRYLEVQAGLQRYRTEMLADMDRIVSTEFGQALPGIIQRTLVSAGAKVAAAYALHRATENDPMANLLTRVATLTYQLSTNQADLRSWTSLPKQFQYVRFPTPADGQVQLELPGQPVMQLSVEPEPVTVIIVKSVQAHLPPRLTRFVLRPPGGKADASHSPIS